jgi:glycerophosphoryl diester phosphodiesterase
MAHRGGSVAAPENTLAAFQAAADLGYRYLETDVHRTLDGELVAFHDTNLRRLTGSVQRISDLTWSEIEDIELEGGHRIPRLVDLLDAFPEHHFNIDPKADDAVEPLIEILRERHAVHRVGIGAFSEKRIRRMQDALGPELCTSPGPAGVARVLAAALLGRRRPLPYGCIQVPCVLFGLRTGRPWLIRRLQRLGLQVHFWTVNDRREMERLLDAGADVIITDAIDVLADVLSQRAARPES